ncbi:Plant-specific TFIIB-related protein 1 [Zea mays]|uniref:Plant-specific TFIIB-related protein 1 n=2 Tax=Zea mays TaxID=4577 RepID=A0A1D6QNU0_MAIZE|nr:Plant-specific TFIIB-related protein 1 [Zea mays]
MDVSVGSRARHLTDVDGDLWDLVRRDLQLKATFLYIDLNSLIACNECEERREEITLLANDFFYCKDEDDEDPFLPAGFVSAFSAFSLERHPVLARSASTFSGHLAELERALAVDFATAASNPDPAGPMVSVDSLRAYLQIVDVASILRLDGDIADHAFELFKDCSSATCLRNRSVEALATAALV